MPAPPPSPETTPEASTRTFRAPIVAHERGVSAPDLVGALAAHPDARARFKSLAPSHRRAHVAWIDEAKRPETRARRVARTVERLAAERLGGDSLDASPGG